MYIFAIFQLLLFLATCVFYVISISSSRSSSLCSRWSNSHKHGGDGDLFASVYIDPPSNSIMYWLSHICTHSLTHSHKSCTSSRTHLPIHIFTDSLTCAITYRHTHKYILIDSFTYAFIPWLTQICSHLLTRSHMITFTDSLTFVLIY